MNRKDGCFVLSFLSIIFSLAACGSVSYLQLFKLESGTQSNVVNTSYRVLQDAASFEKIYASIHASKMPPPKTPEIDFTKNIVVAAFLGQRPSGGYRIEFAEVALKDSQVLRITVIVRAPKTGSFSAAVVTTPYAIAVIEKQSFHEVAFDSDDGNLLYKATIP